MSDPILFCFDFTSPYSYIVSEKIDALAAAHGRQVRWRPILLGPVFKALGTVSLVSQPDKADYSVRDFLRSARFHGLPYVQPANFPVPTVAPARAYYWLHGQDCDLARRFAHGVFRACFVEGRDISTAATTLALARAHGLTLYDAAYLELAMRASLSLATLDKELRSAAKKVGVTVLPEKI
jgi:2-hydroxychromene-2-carboxylate isomerase